MLEKQLTNWKDKAIKSESDKKTIKIIKRINGNSELASIREDGEQIRIPAREMSIEKVALYSIFILK